MQTVSCIIPAFNEAAGIKNVLDAVTPLYGKELKEIIVIDDGSTDGTKDIARAYEQIRCIVHEKNQGKSRAVLHGLEAATGDFILMIDADLIGLTADDIRSLLEPVLSGRADTSMSYRKNAWPLFPFTSVDFLTGERVFLRADVVPYFKDMEHTVSYGIEILLNRILLKKNRTVAIVKWPTVSNVFHYKKRGWIKGVPSMVRIWIQAARTASIFEMYAQNINFKRLMVDPK
jgi:glycosyltransferase involved in cell wall biosynthesis